jgi:hypothetical protein
MLGMFLGLGVAGFTARGKIQNIVIPQHVFRGEISRTFGF